MKKGDIVKIYSDPVTEHDLEGEARLRVKLMDTDTPQNKYYSLEYWQVKFLSDNFIATRYIKVR